MRFLPIAVIIMMAIFAGKTAIAYTSAENNLNESDELYSPLEYTYSDDDYYSDEYFEDYYYEEKSSGSSNLYSYDSSNNQEYNVADYSSLPRRIAPHGERVFIFSPRMLRWAAYDAQGYRVSGGIANGGAHHCEDLGRPCRTPRGTFRIHTKKGADCISNKFPLPDGGAPMPYCMFFNGGYAIHGSPYISGSNTSHGCIRVHTGAARWLHRHFLSRGTKVIVLPY